MRNKKDMYKTWIQNRCRETYGRYKAERNEVKRAVRSAKKEADWRWEEKPVEDFKLL